jgi:hypothetical protein
VQVLKLRADAMTTLLDDVPLPAGDAPASALSCFAYPAHAAVDPPTMGADAHVDRGMLTLVMASPQQHLQVGGHTIEGVDLLGSHGSSPMRPRWCDSS